MTFFIFIDHNLFYSGTEMASIFHILAFLYLLTSRAFDSRAEGKKDEPEKNLAAEIKSLRNALGALSRQVMLQQLFVEERIRSDGDSGVKQVRLANDGTRNYFSEAHGYAKRLLAIHDHTNNIRTVGLGEFVGVLNGVEFRTRHNDYRLFMPSTKNKEYHATEEIPFPDVPPEVKSKPTVEEEIIEMREWFKAWKDQDYSIRDYRKYFKPVLCYLEGAWSTATKDIDEPFESDRHFIDAQTWFELQEKIRFTSYTGRKDNLENFSFLPTTIMELINETIPVFAQWNYRILCHPLRRNIPTNRFRMVDELYSRVPAQRNYSDHQNFRAARFQLNPKDKDKWSERFNSNPKFTLLDQLMSEIPGKNNYQGNIIDEAFDLPAQTVHPKQTGTLNAAYYHRLFKVMRRDAMGQSIRHRGYSDANLYVALTSQSKVAGMNLKICKGPKPNTRCKEVNQKVSYAIPMEIIFLTPLSNWNPFDIEYKGPDKEPYGKTVFENGRNGDRNPKKAYNGTNSRKFYQTPDAFFTGKEVSVDAADTTRESVGVLDRNGRVRICRASGVRVFLPPIKGIGSLRQRYPIMPVHGEGSAVWKELGAMKDLLLQSKTYGYLFREPLGGSGVGSVALPERSLTLQMEDATRTPPGVHTHEVTLTPQEVKDAKTKGKHITKLTTQGAGHQHTIRVAWKNNIWVIRKCDEYDKKKYKCFDQHGMYLSQDLNA